MNTEQLGQVIESFAPLALQEDWDNCGYNVDLHNENVKKVLLCLDVTESVAEEAGQLGCDVIISHHPLLFNKIRKIDSAVFPGTVLSKLLCAGISVYCAHTTMDSAACGINAYLASLLELQDICPLIPAREEVYKLSVQVPAEHAVAVRDALFKAGGGSIGSYSSCSFSVPGTGTFRAMPGADPFIGTIGAFEAVDEIGIEVLVPGPMRRTVLAAAVKAHPYETPAIDLYPVSTAMSPEDGLGRIGCLTKPAALGDFAAYVRAKLDCPEVLVAGAADIPVERVALCSGAGSSVIKDAVRARADVFVTGEVKHEAMTDPQLGIIAAGHFDTEKWFCDAMRDALQRAGLGVQYKVDICVSQSMQRPYTVVI